MKSQKTLSDCTRCSIIGGLSPADNRQLDKLEAQAIDLIRTVSKVHVPLWIAYSGGKDSEVVYHLMKKAKVEFVGFYNNTTIDPPGTISWVKQHENIMIMQPRRSFFQLIEHRGFPSRIHRFCCEKLKERYTASAFLSGIRADESKRRREKYKEPEVCWTYKHGQTSRVYLPILYWTERDIQNYVQEENIQCHPLYYDCHGSFCVNRRLGCIGCPMQYDRGFKEFKLYPKMIRAWCRAMSVYRNTRPTLTKSVSYFENEYENMYYHLFCKNIEQFRLIKQSQSTFNPRETLMQTFEIDLPLPLSPLSALRSRLPNP